MIRYFLAIVPFLIATSAFASLIYIPEKLNKPKARVVVVIHGCLQSAEAMAAGTGWNDVADKNNLVIIYPQVPENSNSFNCWSWYLPENQSANKGQLKYIFDDLQNHLKMLGLSNPQVFATGISSGGAMVAGLAACYPKQFSAIGIHSAPPYGFAGSLEEANKLLQMGPNKRQANKAPCNPRDFGKPVLVLQGLRDKVVNPQNAKALVNSFLGTDVDEKQTTQQMDGGTFTQFEYSKGKTDLGRMIKIPNLTHAWSGFEKHLRNSNFVGKKSGMPTTLPFFDSTAPSSTQLIWEFFDHSTTN